MAIRDLAPGDGCPYCAAVLNTDRDILNCHTCARQGCSDCICAGACCLEDESTADDDLATPETATNDRPRQPITKVTHSGSD